MSAAEVELGGPSAPRWGATLVGRLQSVAARLRASAARLLDPDEGALAAWAAALATAPQAVPNLPAPPNKRLTRATIAVVLVAHLVLLLVLWRSTPPPLPQGEITVELVREEPKPQPKPAAKPEQTPPQRPVQEGKDAGAKDKAAQQAKQEEQKATPQQKAKPEQPKPEQPKPEQQKPEQQKPEPKPKAEPLQPKAARQRQAHRTPPKEQQQPKQPAPTEQKQAQEQQQRQPQQRQQQPAPDQVRPEQQIAMPAVALPGASDAGTDAVSYSQLVLSQVAKAKKQGHYMGVPGYAGVRFRVGEDGSLEIVKLVLSSGDPNLDIEAEAMIRRAAPFPKPPPGGRRDYGITLVFAAQP